MKAIRITALVLLIQTIIWVILIGVTTAPMEPGWESQDYVRLCHSGCTLHPLRDSALPKIKKRSGVLLLANGVLCIFGIIGFSAGSNLRSGATALHC
ncbi:MAG: hypothetical protein V2B15_15505 [Bacteroidota bacterium]